MGASVSNSDSFIDEVTEEVKRDKLYAQMRKYGPIAVALVLALVGGAAWNEYKSAQTTAQAQAAGDAIYDALTETDAATRASALAAAPVDGGAAAVAAMLAGAAMVEDGDFQGAATVFAALAADDTAQQATCKRAAGRAEDGTGNLAFAGVGIGNAGRNCQERHRREAGGHDTRLLHKFSSSEVSGPTP